MPAALTDKYEFCLIYDAKGVSNTYIAYDHSFFLHNDLELHNLLF